MLKIKDMTCGYDAGFLLTDANLDLKEKEMLGIIGPNGSGKTTLLRAITKIIKPQKGGIFFEGKNINTLGFIELAKRIAVVSQGIGAEFNMSVEDYVLLGRFPHRQKFQFLETGHDETVVRRVLQATDSLKFINRPLSQLSGGERQLVFIARALAQEPRLLLLDEPTAHLDITHQVKILDLIKRLNKETGLTTVVILHDLNLASEYCDRLLLLSDGRIHRIGTPQEVLIYEVIEEVYNTVVVVEKNPISSKPYILMVSEEERRKRAGL